MSKGDSGRGASLTQGARIGVFAFLLVVLVLWCGVVLAALTDQWLAWLRWGLTVAGVLTAFGLLCALVLRYVTRPGQS